MADPTNTIGGGYDGVTRNPLLSDNKGTGLIAPKNVISTLTQARTIYWNVRAEHLDRIVLYASIEGLLAGNPPYSPSDLVDAKLNHISNFNPLDARAIYKRSALAYWNALYETENLVQVNLRIKDPSCVEWGDIIAGHYSDLMREWKSFYALTNFLTAQIVKFGLSACIWPDERDWRWRVIDLSKFYVPDQAQSDVNQLTYICVENTYTVQYLYEIWDHYKDTPKKDTPWDTDELARILLLRANSLPKQPNDGGVVNMMDLQRRLQNGDTNYCPIMTDSINTISLFYTEYDGKISHYMFDPWYGEDFMFFADRQYECLEEAALIFTASPGEATLHSNLGVGQEIYSSSQAMMMVDNSIIDMARYASTPLIKSAATGGREFEQIRFYPGVPTNIGMNDFAQGNFGANIGQLIGASQYFLQKINYNAANSGSDPSMPDKNVGSVSPDQARVESYKEFGLPKNNLAHFYSQWDCVHRNTFIKLLESKPGYPGYEQAKEWKERCIEDGVPKEVFEYKKRDYYGLPRHMQVLASRVAGDGSTLGRLMSLQELAALGVVSDMAPEQLYEYKREAILAASGRSYLKAFLPDKRQIQMENNGASVAQLENNTMQQGMAPLFSAANDHRAHIGAHFAAAEQLLKLLREQQIDPVGADKIFSQLVPHTGQHIEALSKSVYAKSFLEGIKKPWEQIQQAAILNRKNAVAMQEAAIRKQQEDQQKQQEVMSDAERKDFTAKKDAERADFKVNEQVERAKEASATRAKIAEQTARDKAANAKLQVQLTADAKKSGSPKESKNAELETTPIEELRSDLNATQGATPSIFDFE